MVGGCWFWWVWVGECMGRGGGGGWNGERQLLLKWGRKEGEGVEDLGRCELGIGGGCSPWRRR